MNGFLHLPRFEMEAKSNSEMGYWTEWSTEPFKITRTISPELNDKKSNYSLNTSIKNQD